VPAMPAWGLAVMTAGGLWAVIWLGRWRFAGIAVVALGLLTVWLAPRPDIRITGSGNLIAVRALDGALLLSNGRAGRFEAEVWNRREGNPAMPDAWPKTGTADGSLRCDPSGCRYRKDGAVVLIAWRIDAFHEDCGQIDLVVSPLPLPSCPDAITIDLRALTERGAHAIYLDRGRVRVETARAGRNARPWS